MNILELIALFWPQTFQRKRPDVNDFTPGSAQLSTTDRLRPHRNCLGCRPTRGYAPGEAVQEHLRALTHVACRVRRGHRGATG